MEEQHPKQSATSRTDLAMAKFVEAGIARQETHGRADAAAYLTENGVNFNVVVRVLAEPDRRRVTDALPPAPAATS